MSQEDAESTKDSSRCASSTSMAATGNAYRSPASFAAAVRSANAMAATLADEPLDLRTTLSSADVLAKLIEGDLAPHAATLEALAQDISVRDEFIEVLPELVEQLPLFERKRLLTRWATDERDELRVAAGRALQSSFVAFGAHDVVRTLVADASERVRNHGTLAAMIRRVPIHALAERSPSPVSYG